MTVFIDGPRVPPARGGKPEALVILLHGYGSNGADLISLAPYWARALPGVAFVAPNAIEPVPQAPGGYQWFPISNLDPQLMEQGARAAAQSVDRFIDRELEKYALTPDRLVLVGFSQGTMMALHVGLRRSSPPAAIVGYSGLLVLPPDLNAEKFAAEIKSRPPILLVHGDRDDLIPAQALFQAGQGLAALDIPVEWHLSAGIGHGIDAEGLRHGGEFLARRFAAKR